MILVYDYNNAMNILKLFTEGNIVTLKIYLDNSLGTESAYVLNYTSIEDYPEEERVQIRSMFNEKTIQLTVQATQVLNEFVTMKETGNVNFFDFEFDIKNTTLLYHRSYKKTLKEISNVGNEEETYQTFVSKFESFLTVNGIHNMTFPGVYQKAPGSAKQQRVKYNPMTFGEVLLKMKDVMISDL